MSWIRAVHMETRKEPEINNYPMQHIPGLMLKFVSPCSWYFTSVL
jgi:hypothetical protein